MPYRLATSQCRPRSDTRSIVSQHLAKINSYFFRVGRDWGPDRNKPKNLQGLLWPGMGNHRFSSGSTIYMCRISGEYTTAGVKVNTFWEKLTTLGRCGILLFTNEQMFVIPTGKEVAGIYRKRREIPEHPVIAAMERWGTVSPHPSRLAPCHLPSGGKAFERVRIREVCGGKQKTVYILQELL